MMFNFKVSLKYLDKIIKHLVIFLFIESPNQILNGNVHHNQINRDHFLKILTPDAFVSTLRIHPYSVSPGTFLNADTSSSLMEAFVKRMSILTYRTGPTFTQLAICSTSCVKNTCT